MVSLGQSAMKNRKIRIYGLIGFALAMVIFVVIAFVAVQLFTVNESKPTNVDKLRVAFRWKLLEYAWPDNETQQLFPHYERDQNIPMGIEAAGDRIFITVPRWTTNVAATLNYIYVNDTNESPLLHPYPSWEAHRYGENKLPETISVFRIRADRCGRLWVPDTGISPLRSRNSKRYEKPPTLVVYNLTTDEIIRKYEIPESQRLSRTNIAAIAVDDTSCEDAYVYIADAWEPGLIVYSWRRNTSWRTDHHYYRPDPLNANFNVSGLFFTWWDGLIGMHVVPESDGPNTLYFHPLCSTHEFSVSTKVLRDLESVPMPELFHQFKIVGSRGHLGQSTSSFFDSKTGVLFQTEAMKNSITCWKPRTSYEVLNFDIIYQNDVTNNFPGDLKIDSQGNIWVISNHLPLYMESSQQLDPDDYNFHILTESVEEVIKETICSLDS